MQKTILLIPVLLLLVVGTQDIQAQSQEETIENLRQLFTESSIDEIEELSPCRIRMWNQPISDTYVSYSFVPNEATWEGEPHGVFADWLVIEETETSDGNEESFRNFSIFFTNDGEELHTEIAELLNHLASFCTLPEKERVITDEDLNSFIFTSGDFPPLLYAKFEELDELLQGYTTPSDTLKVNFQNIYEGAELESLSAVEQEDYKKTKAYFEDYILAVKTIEYDYFYGKDTVLPQYQYYYIYDKVIKDPELFARLEKLTTGW